jgi:N-acylneuraminate cytidylyltransferase
MLPKDLNVVAIIPARSGSKGVKNKNILDLVGYPLIAWSIQAAKKTNLISRVFVDTDSHEYAEVSQEFGAEIAYIRPKEFAQDSSTDFDFINHFINHFNSVNELPDVLVHLRPTTPLRDPQLIDSAIKTFLREGPQLSALRSVHEMSETAYKAFEVSQDSMLETIFTKKRDLDSSNAPRQGFPKTYTANGYVDILNPKFVLNSGLLHGGKVKAFITPQTLEIDTQLDFDLCKHQLNSKVFDSKILWG